MKNPPVALAGMDEEALDARLVVLEAPQEKSNAEPAHKKTAEARTRHEKL